MGITHITVTLKPNYMSRKKYEADFLVDTGATDCFVSGRELRKIGIAPVGKTCYELADGTPKEYEFGLAVIEFIGDVTSGRVIFGPDNVEPILGVTALESVGVSIDPKTRKLQRLPAIPLKIVKK